MILKRCDKGHYYDGEAYQECPECKGSANAGMPYGGSYEGFYGDSYGTSYGTSDEDYADEDTVTVALPRSHTQGYGQGQRRTGAGLPDEENVTAALPRSHAQKQAPRQAWADVSESEEENVTVALPRSHGQGQQGSFSQAAGNRGSGAAAQQHTAGNASRKHSFKPVVGWLVCIQGKDFGSSFTLQLGKNYIGRAAHMDVVLQGDESIGMEKHAAVYYVPKYRRFAAEPGTAGKRFLVNREDVLRPVWIKQHDILTMGNTSLMFFPCCGEHFSWEELLRRHRDSRKQL